MGFFHDVLKGATTLNPKKSAKHFLGTIVDPAGTTIREGRGQSSLPTNAKGYYDPGGALTPKIIGAPPTHAPGPPVVLPPLGQSAQKAPPLPGMMGSAPKMDPTTMQGIVSQAAQAPQAPGGARSFKTAQAPAYTPGAAPVSAAQTQLAAAVAPRPMTPSSAPRTAQTLNYVGK